MRAAAPQFAIIFLLGMMAGAAVIWTQAYGPLYLSGMAEVVDGDSVRVAGVNIRLAGIETPELPSRNEKDCRKLLSRPGCLNRSAMALHWLVDGKPVRCWITGRNALSAYGEWGRPLGVCFFDEIELNAWLLSHCYAEAPGNVAHRVLRFRSLIANRDCPREEAPVARLDFGGK